MLHLKQQLETSIINDGYISVLLVTCISKRVKKNHVE